MSRRKKTVDVVVDDPEIMFDPEPIVESKDEVPATEVAEEPEPEEALQVEPDEKLKSRIVTPETPNYVAMDVKALIRSTLSDAPKRNDATTMPAIVNLRCRTGDMHFVMPQFDANTIQRLWYKCKNQVTPEEFVSYLYSVAGLNPPKLYMYMNIVNIS